MVSLGNRFIWIGVEVHHYVPGIGDMMALALVRIVEDWALLLWFSVSAIPLLPDPYCVTGVVHSESRRYISRNFMTPIVRLSCFYAYGHINSQWPSSDVFDASQEVKFQMLTCSSILLAAPDSIDHRPIIG